MLAQLTYLLVVYILLVQQENKRSCFFNSYAYKWDEPYLFKQGVNRIIRRYIVEFESKRVLESCYLVPYRGHHGRERTTQDILLSSFFWPILFNDTVNYGRRCDQCPIMGTISRRHLMPLNNILEIKIFDIWGYRFYGAISPIRQ